MLYDIPDKPEKSETHWWRSGGAEPVNVKFIGGPLDGKSAVIRPDTNLLYRYLEGTSLSVPGDEPGPIQCSKTTLYKQVELHTGASIIRVMAWVPIDGGGHINPIEHLVENYRGVNPTGIRADLKPWESA